MARLHFGTVNKIFLEYERPFLSPGVDEVVLLWDRVERESEVVIIIIYKYN